MAQAPRNVATAASEPRVAIVYGDYPPKLAGEADGGADFLQELARRLALKGVDVTAIVSARSDRPIGFSDGRVRVEPIVRNWRLGSARQELRRIREVLGTDRPTVIHLIYPDPYLRYESDSYHLPFALKALRLPLVVTFFGFGVTKSSFLSKAGLGSLFAVANFMVITDADLLRRFRHLFPFWSRKADFGLVGSIALDASPRWDQRELLARQSRLGYHADHRYIGFFGFRLPGKGLEDLIEAVARLNSENQRTRLVLIGGHEADHRSLYEQSLVDLARRSGIGDSVIETGPLAREAVAAHLVAMDACVLPFHANPLGRSSLALSLQLGLPTVVTRPFGNEALLDGVAMLDRPDADHIVAALREILGSRGAQLHRAEASRRAAVHWSWDSVVDQYAGIYRRLVTDR